MGRILLVVHAVCVVAAYSVFCLAHLVVSRTTNVGSQQIAVVSAVRILAGAASLTGLAMMIRKSRGSESIVLAVSTVAAILLFALAL